MSKKKPKSKKTVSDTIWIDDEKIWKVVVGQLKRTPGLPGKRLFMYIGEKLPWDCLNSVKDHIVHDSGSEPEGIYLAHDSMGAARYGGRGQIFTRLAEHRRKYAKELVYFSFYVVQNKNHERELETVVLRAAGPQMLLNQRKVRASIDPGNIRDYEPGTSFFERQQRKGKKKRRVRRVKAVRKKI